MRKEKISYKDKISAMMAIAECRKSGRKENPNRREKRTYKYNGKWYLTSKE